VNKSREFRVEESRVRAVTLDSELLTLD